VSAQNPLAFPSVVEPVPKAVRARPRRPPRLRVRTARARWIEFLAVFDVLYALADRDFDRGAGLHSIPARLGIGGALAVSGLLHAVTIAALVASGLLSLSVQVQETIKVGVLHSLSGTMAISETVLKDVTLMAIAEINAKGVIVIGRVAGNVHGTERVEIQATGRLTGNIRAPRVLIAEGATFKGNSDMSPRKDERKDTGCDLPGDRSVNENPRNGFLTLKRK